MEETGVIFGRFQIMHLGYMEYILAAKMRCRQLVIGIGNPDMEHLQYNRSQEGCLRQKMNPFTYFERMEMIKAAMKDFGLDRSVYEIVPFPLEDPPALASYVPRNVTYYMIMHDEWSMEKKAILENLGYKVEILRIGAAPVKKASNSMVLEAMGKKEKWENLVPKSVAVYIKEHHLDDRVRVLWNEKRRMLSAKEKAALEEMPPFVDKKPTMAEILGTENEDEQQKEVEFIF